LGTYLPSYTPYKDRRGYPTARQSDGDEFFRYRGDSQSHRQHGDSIASFSTSLERKVFPLLRLKELVTSLAQLLPLLLAIKAQLLGEAGLLSWKRNCTQNKKVTWEGREVNVSVLSNIRQKNKQHKV
jgi:glutaredoxin 2